MDKYLQEYSQITLFHFKMFYQPCGNFIPFQLSLYWAGVKVAANTNTNATFAATLTSARAEIWKTMVTGEGKLDDKSLQR